MRFPDVQHQQRALSILRRGLMSGRVHHAFLFDGPEGVGKELAARALAARLMCQDADRGADADACERCVSCRLLSSDNHTDFHLIDRSLHKRHPEPSVRRTKGIFLTVDVVRHFLIEPASKRPAVAARRVFLVRDAERMNEEAQNALLKTLEEPPGSACLILVTSAAARLLPTIRSRCQHVPFDLLPADYVQEQMIARAGVDADTAATLAGLAQGRLGAALRWRQAGLLETLQRVCAALADGLPDRPEAFGRALVEMAMELAPRLRERPADRDSAATSAADATNDAADESDDAGDDAAAEEDSSARGGGKSVETVELREALKLVLMLLAALYRDALAAASGGGRRLLSQRFAPPGAWARQDDESLAAAIEAVAHAERMLDRNVAPQLTCERLAVALTGEALPY